MTSMYGIKTLELSKQPQYQPKYENGQPTLVRGPVWTPVTKARQLIRGKLPRLPFPQAGDIGSIGEVVTAEPFVSEAERREQGKAVVLNTGRALRETLYMIDNYLNEACEPMMGLRRLGLHNQLWGLIEPLTALINTLADRDEIVPPDPEATLSGFVYIIRCGEAHKIGAAYDVQKRLEELSTAAPAPLVLVHSIPSRRHYDFEDRLHAKYNAQKIHREWFLLTEADLAWLRSLTNDPEDDHGGDAGCDDG
jgi:Meiotically up-regulated gene 113